MLRVDDDNCASQCFYVEGSGNFLPTICDNLSFTP